MTAAIALLRTLGVGARLGYAALKRLPVQDKVVLMTRQSRSTSRDFAMIAAEVERRSPQTRVVILNHRMGTLPGFLVKVAQETYHLATARACVVDSYMVPVSILTHRPGLVIGQIWHSLGAIKQFGYLSIGKPEGRSAELAEALRMHRNYSFVTACGTVPAAVYAAAFDIDPERILPAGQPRVDYLLDTEGMRRHAEDLIAVHPRLARGRTVLYVPTFREATPMPYAELSAAFLAAAAPEDTLVLRPHANDAARVDAGDQVIVDREQEVLDWLSVADVVITDYSAVVYEAALLDLPMVFYAFDVDAYERSRGLALDYEAEMPGPIVGTAEEAVRAAGEACRVSLADFRARHLDYVTDAEGGLIRSGPSSAARIVDALGI